MSQPPHDVSTAHSPGKAYFEVDGDRRIRTQYTEDSSDRSPTWRGDPEETGSDCTVVVVTNELDTRTYHVHRRVLCSRTRRSNYFAEMIKRDKRRKQKGDSQANVRKALTIKVELDERDAKHFPILLDFMYEPHGKGGSCSSSSTYQESATLASRTMDTTTTLGDSTTLSTPTLTKSSSDDDDCLSGDQITTANAVSLRHLARKFDNDSLTKAVNKFIQKDLNFRTGPIYLCNASDYKDDRLMESAQRLCAENIEQIDVKALCRLPIQLFRFVIKKLETFEVENKQLSLFLSEIVCRYLEKYPESRTAELILELTDPLFMPYIVPEAAIGYTAIVKDLDPEDVTRNWSGLVKLCQRCAKAVVQEYGWSDFSVRAAVTEYLGGPRNSSTTRGNSHFIQREASTDSEDSESSDCRPINSFKSVDSLLFATSFAAALEQAQDDYIEISRTHEHVQTMISTLNKSADVWERVSSKQNECMEKQKRALDCARKEISMLKRQVSDLKSQKQHHQPSPVKQRAPPQHQKPQQVNNQVKLVQNSSQHPSQQHASPQPGQRFSSPQPGQHYSTPQPGHSVVSASHAQTRQPVQTSSAQRSPPLIANQQQSQRVQPPPQSGHHHRSPPPAHSQPKVLTASGEGPPMARYGRQNNNGRSKKPVIGSTMSTMSSSTVSAHTSASATTPGICNKQSMVSSSGDLRLIVVESRSGSTCGDEEEDDDEEEEEEDNDDVYSEDSSRPDLYEMNLPPKELISPVQVGLDVHRNKNIKREELRTRNEMRSKSLLV
jgi:BTB/POZ domain